MLSPCIAVDQIFACIDGADNASRLQDFVLSMVFANAAARAQSQQSDGFASEKFRAGWLAAAGKIGWVVTSAGTSHVKVSSHSATTTVADQILANAPSGEVEKALHALGQAAKAKENQLAQMWWKAGTQFDPYYASLGSVNLTGDVINVELAQFSLETKKLAVKEPGLLHFHSKPLDVKSPDAFFQDVLEESVDLHVYHITATLRVDAFAASRQDLISKLGGKVFDHFVTNPSGLYGDPS